jgi:hypothetical protein
MLEKLFKNSIGYNTARITVETSVRELQLHYHLFDNPIQHIWQNIHLNNSQIINGTSLAIPIKTLLEEINTLCVIENQKMLSLNVTQEDLNLLHHNYVKSNHNDNWLRINSLIHAIENIISNPLHMYDSTINFYAGKEQYIPLDEKFKIFLKPDIVWGRLNLGYATLGKDWIDIVKNDDDLDDLSIQEKITSETVMLFSPEQPFADFQEQKFYKWSNTVTFDIPANLNQLSFGRYPLGQIIIDDLFLDFHNIPSDWYVPNHMCKLRWNQEVLDSTSVIKKIEFFNSDMYFNTLMTHTGFKNA